MRKKDRDQLLSNNQILILNLTQLLESNQETQSLLFEERQTNISLITHLKELYKSLANTKVKTREQETQYELLKKILIDFWDYQVKN